MLFRIVTAIAVAATLFAASQFIRANQLERELQSSGIQLVSCGARLDSLRRDIFRDTNIDRIPDDALRAVPPHWLRPGSD
jgi:hypothetical protein